MMIEDAWKQFAVSGKIDDYLSYKQLKDMKSYGKKQNTDNSKRLGNKGNEHRGSR